jgi:hypothetical protein
MKKFLTTIACAVLAGTLAIPAAAQTTTTTKSTTATKKSSAPANNASDADIAAAQKAGKVWVNTGTGVYHKGGQYYGKTKQGKFMMEDDAKKAGYHEDKTEASKGKKS